MKKAVNGQEIEMSSAELADFQAHQDQPLEARRATANLSRRDFCLAALAQGFLLEQDAIEAARGGWPASFAAAVPAEQATAAQIIWASASRVDRMDPLLLTVAASHSPPITEEQLDAMFGLL